MRRRKSRRRKAITHERKVRYANKLRKRMTRSELILWGILRRMNESHNTNFQPQQIVCGFIPDFYCNITEIVIEVDGDVHNKPSVMRKDSIKNQVFKTKGKKLIRFTNYQVNNMLAWVATCISNKITST